MSFLKTFYLDHLDKVGNSKICLGTLLRDMYLKLYLANITCYDIF